MIYVVALASVLLNASAQIFLRKTTLEIDGLGEGGRSLISLAGDLVTSRWLALGMLCYAFSIGIWIFVLSKLEVSVAYPLLSVGYIVTAVIGYTLLGEQVGAYRAFGIAFICLGVVLVAKSA